MATTSRPQLPTEPLPVITIFVRHRAGCQYAGDETTRKCACPKHLRWSYRGSQHRRSAKTCSWPQAELARQGVEDQYRPRSTRRQENQRRTIEEAVSLFVRSKENEELAIEVVRQYKRSAMRFQEFMEKRCGRIFLEEIAPEDVVEYQATWKKLYPASTTRALVLTNTRHFIKFCVERELLEKPILFTRVKVIRSVTQPFTNQEFEQILNHIPKMILPVTPEGIRRVQRLRGALLLMRWSGLAIRDAVTLERSRLYKDENERWRIVTSRHKTKNPVSVVVPEQIGAELAAIPNGHPDYLLWNTGKGSLRSLAQMWYATMRDVFVAAGIPGGHSHRLRDTFAVDLLSKGVPLEDVSKLLGHKSIRTTEMHYAPWVRARQDRLDKLVAGTWDAPEA